MKNLKNKAIKSAKNVKGGALGRGTRTTSSRASTRTELL